jgi:hypothetical protein
MNNFDQSLTNDYSEYASFATCFETPVYESLNKNIEPFSSLIDNTTQMNTQAENNTQAEDNTQMITLAENDTQIKTLSEANTQLNTNIETTKRIIAENNAKIAALTETNLKLREMANALSGVTSEIPSVRNLCPKTALSDWKYTDIQYIIGPATNYKPYPECGKQFDTLAATNIKKGKGNLVFSPRALPNGLTYTQCNPSNLSNLQTTAAVWGSGNKVVSIPSNCSSSTGLFASTPISNNPASEGILPSNISPVPVSSNNVRTLCDKKLGSDWTHTDIQYIVGPATGNQAYPECNKQFNTLAAANYKKTGKNLVFPTRVLPNGLKYTQCNPSTLTNLKTTAAVWGPKNIVATVPSNCSKNSGLIANTPIFNTIDPVTPTNNSVSRSVTPIGGQRDSNGCLVSAGYKWCATLKRCIRSGQTRCPLKK